MAMKDRHVGEKRTSTILRRVRKEFFHEIFRAKPLDEVVGAVVELNAASLRIVHKLDQSLDLSTAANEFGLEGSHSARH